LIYTYQSHGFIFRPFSYSAQLRLHSREPHTPYTPHTPHKHYDNGVSLLLQDEDELLAEDDLFWEAYEEPPTLTPEEAAAELEFNAHRSDVIMKDRAHSLRALIWWMAEGGVAPADWEVPSKAYLTKVGGRGMERMLESITAKEEGRNAEDDGEAGGVFEEGWADFAKAQYRVVVFSKVRHVITLDTNSMTNWNQSYCQYSKRAKATLSKYRLSPSPFIIELDHRCKLVCSNVVPTLTCHSRYPSHTNPT
jgi:hypothetical protein